MQTRSWTMSLKGHTPKHAAARTSKRSAEDGNDTQAHPRMPPNHVNDSIHQHTSARTTNHDGQKMAAERKTKDAHSWRPADITLQSDDNPSLCLAVSSNTLHQLRHTQFLQIFNTPSGSFPLPDLSTHLHSLNSCTHPIMHPHHFEEKRETSTRTQQARWPPRLHGCMSCW